MTLKAGLAFMRRLHDEKQLAVNNANSWAGTLVMRDG